MLCWYAVLVLRLLVRLVLVLSISGALPAAEAGALSVSSGAGSGHRLRRADARGTVVGRLAARDATRDTPARSKQLTSALPEAAALVVVIGCTLIGDGPIDAARPVDRRTSASPRAPPSLI
jgi:hypothetical protein